MQTFIRLIALLLCLPMAASAAPANGPAAKVRLLAFSRVGDEMEGNITNPDGQRLCKKPVAVPTQQLSAAEQIAGNALVFTAPLDAKKILGKVALPTTGGEFVLVFLPAPANSPQPYFIDAVALPASNFGSGDYAFLNYSG